MQISTAGTLIHPLTHLSVDATLNGPAVYWDIFLFVLQLVTFGNPDHLLHQVQASNTLCNWMFHLGSKDKQRGYRVVLAC